MSKQYELTLKFLDIRLEENQVGLLPKARTGCFLQYDGNFVDVIMIKEGAQMVKPDTVSLALTDSTDPSKEDPELVFILKDIQNDDPYVGSISMLRSMVLDGQLNHPYQMWFTLFDSQSDDEYDGAMGLTDDEDPRVLMELTLNEKVEAKPVPEVKNQRQVYTSKTSTTKTTTLQSSNVTQSTKQITTSNVSQKTSTGSRVMAPIGNMRGQPQRTSVVAASTVASTAKGRARKDTAPQQKKAPATRSPQKTTTMTMSAPNQMKLVPLQDIKKTLESNPSKRQNVKFLRQLLDSQLESLTDNLQVIQNNNSKIETETIQRLLLIEKFGNDASNGLQLANEQNQRLHEDLNDQKNQHREVLQDQNDQQLQYKKIHDQKVSEHQQVRSQLDQLQSNHQKSMLEKQELLREQLSAQTQKADSKVVAQIEKSRGALVKLQADRNDGYNNLRDLKRQIPIAATDFQFEFEKSHANIHCLIEQTADVKGEIICLEEELKTEKLRGFLLDSRIEVNDVEIDRLEDRSQQLENHQNECIEDGDNIYTQLREEMKNQDEIEGVLQTDSNELANKDNLMLRSKLNANKGDFERLRATASQKDGPIGNDLERLVSSNDKVIDGIIENKKNAHKHMTNIRDDMKCDIGKDQKQYKADLSQVDNTCKHLEQKDQQLYRELMKEKDLKQKEYLANKVANGLWGIMYSDKVDIEQHIDFNKSGMDKLNKMTEKQKVFRSKQVENFSSQQQIIKQMMSQIAILTQEKNTTLIEIAKNKKELEDLLRLLNQKKLDIEEKDEIIARLESEIDDLYLLMEKLEYEIEWKNEQIRELENQLRMLLNKKPEPTRQRIGNYIPVKGDEIDEKLADYINEFGTPVPWKRVSVGVYWYGTKKVTVKIIRGNLIIKVGGGYMKLEVFIANYEDIEIAKLNQLDPTQNIISSQNPELSGLTKQQRVQLARGASPKNVVGHVPANINTQFSAVQQAGYTTQTVQFTQN